MMFGPALPLLLLALPVLVAAIVVIAGLLGAVASLFRRPVEALPRAVARPVTARPVVARPQPIVARVRAFTEDEATRVFERGALAG